MPEAATDTTTVPSPTPSESTAGTSSPGVPPQSFDSISQAEWERQWANAVGSCLIELGWQVKITDDGISSTVPPEQRSAFDADSQQCEEQFAAAHPVEPLTSAHYQELYRQELEAMACLEAEGYPPLREPVSEQEYVAAYLANQPPPWSAYEAFTGTDLRGIEERCPQPSLFAPSR